MAKYFIFLAAGSALFVLSLLKIEGAEDLARATAVYVVFVALTFGHAIFWTDSDLWLDEETREYRRRRIRGEADEGSSR